MSLRICHIYDTSPRGDLCMESYVADPINELLIEQRNGMGYETSIFIVLSIIIIADKSVNFVTFIFSTTLHSLLSHNLFVWISKIFTTLSQVEISLIGICSENLFHTCSVYQCNFISRRLIEFEFIQF